MVANSEKANGVFVREEHDSVGDVHAGLVDFWSQALNVQAELSCPSAFVGGNGKYGVLE